MSFRSLLWPWIILIIGLSAVPYLALQFLAPPGSQFLGAVINPDDLSVYLAAIQQGAAGEWLFTVTFTPEKIAPKLTYPFYLLLGRLAAQLSIDPLWLFHISRVLTGPFMMLLVVAWLDYLGLTQVRRDAFILIFLSGGWGGLALAAGWILPDIHVAEWTPFLMLTYAPHFILGLAAEILVMTDLLAAYRKEATGDRMDSYLPRHNVGRVFAGQCYVSVNPDQKVALACRFFLAEKRNTWRLGFLAKWGITHIYYGHDESQVGPPPDLPGWDVVYAADGVTIYRGGRN